jgi:hypothetical protein
MQVTRANQKYNRVNEKVIYEPQGFTHIPDIPPLITRGFQHLPWYGLGGWREDLELFLMN